MLAWAVIGDVSETDVPNPDYMFQPPEVSTSVAVVVVEVALVLAYMWRCDHAGRVPVWSSRYDGTHGGSTIADRWHLRGVRWSSHDRKGHRGQHRWGIMLMFGPFIVAGLLAVSALLWHR